MKKNLYLPIFCLFTLFLGMAAGCGGKNPYKIVPVRGTATYQGKPLPADFMLEFKPAEGRASMGKIQGEAGSFEAIYSPSKKGVQVGEQTVRILWGKNPETDPVPEEYVEMMTKYGMESPGKKIEIKKKDLNLTLEFD